MTKIQDIVISRLLLREQEAINQVVAGSLEEDVILSKVSDFLLYWRGRPWIDSEQIEVTGAKLFLSATPQLWTKIVDLAKFLAPELASEFVSFSLATGEEAIKDNSPSGDSLGAPPVSAADRRWFQTEIDDGRVAGVYDAILAANDEYARQISSGMSIRRYLAFLAVILGRLGIKSGQDRNVRASLMHRLSRSFLTWAPSEEKAWRFLGHAYALEAAFREEEVVALEELRRFNSRDSWAFLLDLLSRFQDRQEDYYKMSAVPVAQGVLSSRIIAHRIRAILRQRDLSGLETASELVGQLVRMANGENSAAEEIAKRLFWNVHLLAHQSGTSTDSKLDRDAIYILSLSGAFQSAEWYARRFSGGQAVAKRVLQRGMAREPENHRYLDYLGRLSILGVGDEISDGILSIHKAIQLGGGKDSGTRNWLAMGLVKRGEPHDLEEAARVLWENIELFQDDESRKLLSKVENGDLSPVVAQCSPENKLVEVDRIKGVGADHFATRRERFASSRPSRFPLPDGLDTMATLKKFSVILSGETDALAREGLVSEIIKIRDGHLGQRGPSVYSSVLLARYDFEPEREPSLTPFAAQFEYALNRGDRNLLTKIESEYPKLAALCILARAMFGDIEAANEVSRFLDSPEMLPVFDRSVFENVRVWLANGNIVGEGDVGPLTSRLASDVVERAVRAGNEALIQFEIAA